MDPISINLDLPIDSYSINISHGWQHLESAIKSYVGNKVMLVTDENVKELFVHDITSIISSMDEVPYAVVLPGEASKSLKIAEALYTQALNAMLTDLLPL